MSVEDGWDELWVAVKCQSNLEIAGSPRNAWRCSRCEGGRETLKACVGGRALDGCGAVCRYQAQPNHECPREEQQRVRRRGLTSARQEGNNPDRRLRARKGC